MKYKVKNKKEMKKIKPFLIIAIILGIFIGIPIGMILQQMSFTASAVQIGKSIEGNTLNVEVDINETQLIEGLRETFLPLLNETIKENDFITENCTGVFC